MKKLLAAALALAAGSALAQALVVAPFGTATTRPAFSVLPPVPARLGASAGTVAVGAACDCSTSIVSGKSTYCAVAGTAPPKLAICAPAPVKPPPVVVPPPPPTPTPVPVVWNRIAVEGATVALAVQATVRYGAGSSWIVRQVGAGRMDCTNAAFGSDPIVGTVKECQTPQGPPVVVVVDPPPVVTPPPSGPPDMSGMIDVDPTSLVRDSTVGLSVPWLEMTNEAGALQVRGAGSEGMPPGSDFRTICDFSHMAKDDPIVFPGQPGKSHVHAFFGNTAADAFLTPENIRTRGKSTCRGGTIDLSARWQPVMVDDRTSKAIKPSLMIVYYKSGAWVDIKQIQPLPPGLRMIAGNPKATTSEEAGASAFVCNGIQQAGVDLHAIPQCAGGEAIWAAVLFPQCWDGKNLDSPDHKSHMHYGGDQAGPTALSNGCPASHPVLLPLITLTVVYPAWTDPEQWKHARLSSDMYDRAKPGGYSLHGDWFNGWDPEINKAWTVSCLNAGKDCGAELLGDNRRMGYCGGRNSDCAPPPRAVANGWMQLAAEGGWYSLDKPTLVRMGPNADGSYLQMIAPATRYDQNPCDPNQFPGGPAVRFGQPPRFCEVQVPNLLTGAAPPPPAVVDHSGMGPMVDPAKVPARAVYAEELRIRTTWRDGTRWYNTDGKTLNPLCSGWGGDGQGGGCQTDVLDPNCPGEGPWCYRRPQEVATAPNPEDIGAFREPCRFGWMEKNDAIVYPNRPGASHLHEGVGQLPPDLSAPTDPTVDSPSSCDGGRANQTRYWHPALIDTLDGTPLTTTAQVSYYKGGYDLPIAKIGRNIAAIPVGLRMIVGNAKNTDRNFAIGSFTCFQAPTGAQGPTFNNFGDLGAAKDANGAPYCNEGADMIVGASFPQCWDGVNLDSPNHMAHVVNPEDDPAAPGSRRCPLDHPVALVKHSQNWHYTVHAGQVARLRLSSDMYDLSLPGGLSYHQDVWFNWKPEVMRKIVDNCVGAQVDCHADLLNDAQGNTLY